MVLGDSVPLMIVTRSRRAGLLTSPRGLLPTLGRSQRSSADWMLATDESGIGFRRRFCRPSSQSSDCFSKVSTRPRNLVRGSCLLMFCSWSHSAPKRLASDLVFFALPVALQIGWDL